jgi:hypothetical protein
MRFISVILLTLLILVSLAQAEPRIPGVTGMGVKLGFGYATIGTSVNEFADEDSFAGGTFGGFVTYSLTPELSLQPELLFVAKGSGGSFFRGRSWRHNYLEFPVLMRYSLSQNGTLKPSLFIGPAVAFLLSSDFKSSFIGHTIDTKDAMNGTDLSIVLGGALDYRHFSLDIRYDLGLVNVYDPAKWNQLVGAQDPVDIYHMTQNDSIKNRFFSFALCYRF